VLDPLPFIPIIPPVLNCLDSDEAVVKSERCSFESSEVPKADGALWNQYFNKDRLQNQEFINDETEERTKGKLSGKVELDRFLFYLKNQSMKNSILIGLVGMCMVCTGAFLFVRHSSGSTFFFIAGVALEIVAVGNFVYRSMTSKTHKATA
jgi:hypothetical protein